MTTLAARVLEAIEAVERRVNAWEHDSPDDGGHYSCAATRTEPLGDLPWGDCDCGLDARRSEALRRCAADRRRLERHSPKVCDGGYLNGSLVCAGEADPDDPYLDTEWPCEDFKDLAYSLGVPLEQEETNDGPQARG